MLWKRHTVCSVLHATKLCLLSSDGGVAELLDPIEVIKIRLMCRTL